MPEKNLYTLSDTSKILGLSLTTIRRWSASGKLPTIHFSKRTVRVSRSVIEAVLAHGLPEQPVQEAKS
jgi:excisionase family DNA binding protein